MENTNTFETGAKTAAANNLVLSVLNDGAVYGDRLHAGFAELQGAVHRLSFRDLANNEAVKQRAEFGSKFKAAEISDAAKIIRAQTLEDCVEIIAGEYNRERSIICSGRKWRDNVNGNTYFSVHVQIPRGVDCYRSVNIPFQYGYGDQWEWESVKLLKFLGLSTTEWENKPRSELPVRFIFEGVMRRRDMYEGVYLV